MDTLAVMEIFVRIVETGSFSTVAHEAGLTQPTVSTQLTALERKLNTRLLHRSTRSLSLTEAGAAYYERCRRIIEQAHAAELSLATVEGGVSGTLSVNSSVAFGQMFLTRLLLEFQGLHPELSVRLTLNDRYIDLIEEGIDVAIRFGRQIDASLLARRLAGSPVSVVAARAYVDRHGAPEHPFDLAGHRCLHYIYLSTGDDWVFPSPGGEIRVRVSSTFRSNNGYALRDAMLAGHGIAIMPLVFIQEDLSQGRVVRMLQAFTASPIPVNAVYPSARSVSAGVRLFVDFLHERLRQIPGLVAP